jgi:hypothetical protein
MAIAEVMVAFSGVIFDVSAAARELETPAKAQTKQKSETVIRKRNDLFSIAINSFQLYQRPISQVYAFQKNSTV